MATEPATTWLPAIGNGDFTTGSANTLADASANTLADASSNSLVDSGVTFNQIYATTWGSGSETAQNPVWLDPNQGEFVTIARSNIATNSGNLIITNAGSFIVTGISQFNAIPATVWVSSEGTQ